MRTYYYRSIILLLFWRRYKFDFNLFKNTSSCLFLMRDSFPLSIKKTKYFLILKKSIINKTKVRKVQGGN